MRSAARHRARQAPSLAWYLAGFFLLVSVALSAFAALLWRDLDGLITDVLQGDQEVAAQELQQAQLALAQEVEALLASVEAWDEARGQLEEPTYYRYWRDSRATAHEDFRIRPEVLELYDAQGRALAQPPAGGLPERLTTLHAKPWLAQYGGRVYAYFTAPLLDPEGRQLLGYAAVTFPLPESLARVHAFRRADPATLRITLLPGLTVPYGELPRHTRFAPRPNPAAQQLSALAQQASLQLGVGLVVVLVLAFLLLRAVTVVPLTRLIRHLDALRAGHASLLDAPSRGLPVKEMDRLRQALNDYQLRLEELHGDLANKNDELWRLAHHDPLTGVYNRRALEDDWRRAISGRTPAPLPVSLSLFDCDHFKAINDTYGHHVGDEVIQAFARCLVSALRSKDRLYRLGGDEFATVLWNTPAEEAARLAQRCLDAVTAHDFTVYGVKEPVRMSVGIAEARTLDEHTREELQRRADLAMYHAKRPGGTKIVVYSESLEDKQALLSHSETHAVWAAMRERERLLLHYQPVYDLASGSISHFEALVRIRDGIRLVMPSVILPLVEMRGCECELDHAVLDRLREDLARGAVPAGTAVAFNVSGPGMVDARLIERILALAASAPAHPLILEITETSLITRISEATDHLQRLREAGLRVALDDFGNGYSSLRYLAHMPVDEVKFDRALVHTLTAGDRQAVLVRDLARLIADAGYGLVAEGIESAEMLAAVKAAGFHKGQGFHLGAPAPLL